MQQKIFKIDRYFIKQFFILKQTVRLGSFLGWIVNVKLL